MGGPGFTANDIAMLNTQDHENKQVSLELRLVSSGEGALNWIAGLYYFSEDAAYSQNTGFGPFGIDFTNPLTVSGGPPLPGQPIGDAFALFSLTGNPYSNQVGFNIAELENDVISPYFHGELDLTDRLTLTAGLRYTGDQKRAPSTVGGNVDTSSLLARDTFRSEDVIRSLAVGLPLCDFDGDGNNIHTQPDTSDNVGRPCAQNLSRDDFKFTEWSGKLGLDFWLNDNVLLYTSYSRGFRSGKYDIEFFHGPQIGLKSDFLAGDMQLNLAAFSYTWNDQQLFIVDPFTGPTFTNIEESEFVELEAELQWVPSDNWFVQAGIGLLGTEISNDGEPLFGIEGRMSF